MFFLVLLKKLRELRMKPLFNGDVEQIELAETQREDFSRKVSKEYYRGLPSSKAEFDPKLLEQVIDDLSKKN